MSISPIRKIILNPEEDVALTDTFYFGSLTDISTVALPIFAQESPHVSEASSPALSTPCEMAEAPFSLSIIFKNKVEGPQWKNYHLSEAIRQSSSLSDCVDLILATGLKMNVYMVNELLKKNFLFPSSQAYTEFFRSIPQDLKNAFNYTCFIQRSNDFSASKAAFEEAKRFQCVDEAVFDAFKRVALRKVKENHRMTVVVKPRSSPVFFSDVEIHRLPGRSPFKPV